MYGIGEYRYPRQLPPAPKRDRYEVKYREVELEFAFNTGRLEGDSFENFEEFYQYRYGNLKKPKRKKIHTIHLWGALVCGIGFGLAIAALIGCS